MDSKAASEGKEGQAMTSLDFHQVSSRTERNDHWIDVKTYQLTPWPEKVEITYYDFGPDDEIKKGDRTRFDWENGSAEYEALESGLDVICKLLPGSTWKEPPAKAKRKGEA
jgi:hypothetical protein